MNPSRPIKELQAYLAETATRCRAMRWFGALFRVSVAQDIAADVAKVQVSAGRGAYTIQQGNLEAVRLARIAQCPDSPGGKNITPEEAVPIVRLMNNGAERACSLTEELATA